MTGAQVCCVAAASRRRHRVARLYVDGLQVAAGECSERVQGGWVYTATRAERVPAWW